MAADSFEEFKLAVLVDGDNAQPSTLPAILTEATRYGLPIIRRIYGDWTTPSMNGWKETLHTFSINPVQQFRYTTGKNATDSTLIIDAMDILYGGKVNVFFLVSSDSDYTRLATRIREEGLRVVGVGKKTTPAAFINACDLFIRVENLINPVPTTKVSDENSRLVKLFGAAFEQLEELDGWVDLSALGSSLRKLDPSFDPRTYGHKQLLALIEANKQFIEIKRDSKSIYIRLK